MLFIDDRTIVRSAFRSLITVLCTNVSAHFDSLNNLPLIPTYQS